jgi:hypothetical protein
MLGFKRFRNAPSFCGVCRGNAPEGVKHRDHQIQLRQGWSAMAAYQAHSQTNGARGTRSALPRESSGEASGARRRQGGSRESRVTARRKNKPADEGGQCQQEVMSRIRETLMF